MMTTIVKIYSDGKPIESVSIGEMDESRARALVIHKIQKDLLDCTLAASFTHIVNRQRYVLVFFDPIRVDFVDFVNKLFQSRPSPESIRDVAEGYNQ